MIFYGLYIYIFPKCVCWNLMIVVMVLGGGAFGIQFYDLIVRVEPSWIGLVPLEEARELPDILSTMGIWNKSQKL